jgi:hypothetical protein
LRGLGKVIYSHLQKVFASGRLGQRSGLTLDETATLDLPAARRKEIVAKILGVTDP